MNHNDIQIGDILESKLDGIFHIVVLCVDKYVKPEYKIRGLVLYSKRNGQAKHDMSAKAGAIINFSDWGWTKLS